MRKLKPLHPAVFFGAFPTLGNALDLDDPNVVVPIQSGAFACYGGPLQMIKGVPMYVDAQVAREMRIAGAIYEHRS